MNVELVAKHLEKTNRKDLPLGRILLRGSALLSPQRCWKWRLGPPRVSVLAGPCAEGPVSGIPRVGVERCHLLFPGRHSPTALLGGSIRGKTQQEQLRDLRARLTVVWPEVLRVQQFGHQPRSPPKTIPLLQPRASGGFSPTVHKYFLYLCLLDMLSAFPPRHVCSCTPFSYPIR